MPSPLRNPTILEIRTLSRINIPVPKTQRSTKDEHRGNPCFGAPHNYALTPGEGKNLCVIPSQLVHDQPTSASPDHRGMTSDSPDPVKGFRLVRPKGHGFYLDRPYGNEVRPTNDFYLDLIL